MKGQLKFNSGADGFLSQEDVGYPEHSKYYQPGTNFDSLLDNTLLDNLQNSTIGV